MTKFKRLLMTAILAVSMIGSSFSAMAADTAAEPKSVNKDGEVTFPVSQSWDSGTVDASQLNEKVSYSLTPTDADADCTVSPSSFTLDGDGAQQDVTVAATVPGVYTYQLAPSASNENGYTYDDTVYTIRVYAKNNGNGGISTYITAQRGDDETDKTDAISYSHKFTALITADDPPVEKVITGDKPAEAKEFSFTMTPDDTSYPLPAYTKVTVSTDDHGEAEFGSIVFIKPGTYSYTVREDAGDLDGFEYDDTVYKIVYTVDDYDGALRYVKTLTKDGENVSADGAKFTFTNEYTAPSAPDDNRHHHHHGGGGNSSEANSAAAVTTKTESTVAASTESEVLTAERPADGSGEASTAEAASRTLGGFTGDNSQIFLYGGVTFAAAAAFAIWMAAQKKRR